MPGQSELPEAPELYCDRERSGSHLSRLAKRVEGIQHMLASIQITIGGRSVENRLRTIGSAEPPRKGGCRQNWRPHKDCCSRRQSKTVMRRLSHLIGDGRLSRSSLDSRRARKS